MGTRAGDLDPGVLIYLMRGRKFDTGRLEELVDHCSGLLGISGISNEMRRLHEAASSNAHAQLAIRMFCSSVARQAAAMIVALDGLDMIVFTGGIGENDGAVRSAICGHLAWMGVKLDEGHNCANARSINDPASRRAVQVLVPQEDQRIARHTWKIKSGS